MTIVLALLVGVGLGLYTDRQTQRRIRAERNLARLQRDQAEQHRDDALRGNVLVLDPKMRQDRPIHPAYRNLPRQGER